jgi:hypothetical protein
MFPPKVPQGQWREGHWVFDGIGRGSGKCFLVRNIVGNHPTVNVCTRHVKLLTEYLRLDFSFQNDHNFFFVACDCNLLILKNPLGIYFPAQKSFLMDGGLTAILKPWWGDIRSRGHHPRTELRRSQ